MRKNSRRGSGVNRTRSKKIRRDETLPSDWNGRFVSPLSSLMDSLAFGVTIVTHSRNILYKNRYFLEY